MRYSVILPIYNEEGNLARLFEQVSSVMKRLGGEFEIIAVNDGSTDKTPQALNQFQKKYPSLRVITFAKNCGQSAALAAGFQVSSGEIVITLDSDLQNDPEDIPEMVRNIEQGADFVCGIRMKRQDTWSKRAASRFANGLRRFVLGDHIQDTGCTLKVFRRVCLSAFVYFTGAHRFFAILVEKSGFRVVQIGVRHHPRVMGESKYNNWKRGWQGFWDLFMVRALIRKRKRYEVVS
jgi:glycosyltransferase involved in cell wall biosynthesis